MAKVNQGQMKQWADGDTIHGPEYSQERDLVILALNDAQQQIIDMKAGPSVTNTMLVNGSVNSDKLANNAVTPDKILNKSVTSDKLNDNSVTNVHIADGAVGPTELADASVTSGKLAPEAVTPTKIAQKAVNSGHLAENAVQTQHIADGSIFPTKVVPEVVTNIAYTKEQTDSRIAESLKEGVPQTVINELKAAVTEELATVSEIVDNLSSETINVLPADTYGPARVPTIIDVKKGIYTYPISSTTVAAWKTSLGITDNPVAVRETFTMTSASKVVGVQEVYTDTGASYWRTISEGVWTSWKKTIDTAGMASVTDKLDTDLKTYMSANYVKPSEELSANLVMNSAAALGLVQWTNVSATYPWTAVSQSSYSDIARSYFQTTPSIPSGAFATLTSASITVAAGSMYMLQAMFMVAGNASLYIEVVNATSGAVIATLNATTNSPWHRKSTQVSIPAGVTKVYLKLQATNGVGGSKAVTNIKLSKGSKDVSYTNEADSDALFQYYGSGAALIENAVISKGSTVSKAGSIATFSELVAGVNSIQQGRYSKQIPYITGRYDVIPQTTQELAVLSSFAKGTKVIFIGGHATGRQFQGWANANNFYMAVALKDAGGVYWDLHSPTGVLNSALAASYFSVGDRYVTSLEVDLVAGTSSLIINSAGTVVQDIQRITSSKPANFSIEGPVSLVYYLVRNTLTSSGYKAAINFTSVEIISM